MANITITDINVGGIALHDEEFRDDLLVFAGDDTYAAGTILARDSVSLKLVLFVKGGSTNQNGIPKAVLTYPVSRVGAGDVKVRALVKGVVDKNRLIIDADGTGANIDNAVLDQLRDYDIVALDVAQLGGYDTHD
jgi:hypothetical protein